MTVPQIIFLLTAAVMVVSSLMVVTARNLVHAALWLIVSLFTVAIIFVLLEAGFLAAVQVVLYIGAIAILIIFAIMLTNRLGEKSIDSHNHLSMPALLAGVIFFVIVSKFIQNTPF